MIEKLQLLKQYTKVRRRKDWTSLSRACGCKLPGPKSYTGNRDNGYK